MKIKKTIAAAAFALMVVIGFAPGAMAAPGSSTEEILFVAAHQAQISYGHLLHLHETGRVEIEEEGDGAVRVIVNDGGGIVEILIDEGF